MSIADPISAQADLDLMVSRRAFAVSQETFAGAVHRTASEAADVGWHGTDLHSETGAVALVREDGDFVDLVGEIVKITRSRAIETRTVYAYVIGTARVVDDISLARRTFMGLGILANELLVCSIEVVA